MYEQRVQWLRSVAQWRVSDALQLKNTFYVYDALRDYRNVETYTFNATNTAVTRTSPLLQRHDQQLVGDRLEGTYQGQLAGRKSDWAFGLDVSVNKQTRFPFGPSVTVSTVNPYHFSTENFFDIPGMSPVLNPDKDNKITNTALYLENRTLVASGVNLVSALRHERIDLDLVNRRAVTATAPATFSRSYSPTTGRPSEVGSKFDFWDGKGSATVAAFEIRRKNIASQDPSNPNLTVLVGEQSSKGIELSAGIRPTPQWQLQGNLALTRARYENFVQGGVSRAG